MAMMVLYNRLVAVIGRKVAHKRLVNLELIERQPLEVLQG